MEAIHTIATRPANAVSTYLRGGKVVFMGATLHLDETPEGSATFAIQSPVAIAMLSLCPRNAGSIWSEMVAASVLESLMVFGLGMVVTAFQGEDDVPMKQGGFKMTDFVLKTRETTSGKVAKVAVSVARAMAPPNKAFDARMARQLVVKKLRCVEGSSRGAKDVWNTQVLFMLAEDATVAGMLHEAFHALEGEEAALKDGVLVVVCITTDSRCIYVHGKFLKLRRAIAEEDVTDDTTEWVSGNTAADDTLELCVPRAFVGTTATREWPTAQAA